MTEQKKQFIQLSALQHYRFCPRQCALIHLEQIWFENRLTAQGRQMHERVHEAENENQHGLRIVRGLRLISEKLRLVGQADVVEFHQSPKGISIIDAKGLWQPSPVEYKRGREKKNKTDEIQLCAQAMCLEEMLKTVIDSGSLFYGLPRRRTDVYFDSHLRKLVIETAAKVHELFESQKTPRQRTSPKCKNCSLNLYCMPKVTGINKKTGFYLKKAFEPPDFEEQL